MDLQEELVNFCQNKSSFQFVSNLIQEEVDDLQQDFFLYCFRRLKDFDSSKGSLKNFFRVLLQHFLSERVRVYNEHKRKFVNYELMEVLRKEGTRDSELEILEHEIINVRNLKKEVKMKQDLRELFFDLIVNLWNEEEKRAIKEYVKKDVFTTDDIYPCFGFFYWKDKECEKCILKRLCREAIKQVWIPYIFDFIRTLTPEEKQEFVLTIVQIFEPLIQIRNVEKKVGSTVSGLSAIQDKYKLETYGFKINSRMGRLVYYLLENDGDIDKAVEQTANEFHEDPKSISRYFRTQGFYFLRKRGFKIEKLDNKRIKLIFPEGTVNANS